MSGRAIFVLGLQRSGTTWAGNLLAAHPDTAAATDPRHRGIHESVFFSHFARAWDWSDPRARAEAARAFAGSHYGRLIGADADAMTAAPDAARAFAGAMDAYAARRGAAHWVEKSPHHTRLALEIARALPRARFLCVTRGSGALVLSRLSAYGRRPATGLARAVAVARGAASNRLHARTMAALAKACPERVHRLSYEALRADPEGTMAAALGALGLAPCRGLASQFAANSSFDGGARPVPTPADRVALALGEALGRALPRAVLAAPRHPDFPHWVWPDPVPATEARP